MEFLTTQGSNYISNNASVQLRGVGLGNWLNLEHFMFGLPGTDSQIRQAILETYGLEKSTLFWDTYYSVYVHEEDIRYVQECVMNHVRIPINYQLFFTDSFEKSVAIREIDRILPYLKNVKSGELLICIQFRGDKIQIGIATIIVGEIISGQTMLL